MTKKSILATVATLALATTAFAGHKSTAPVYIYDMHAYGSLGDARASTNGVEMIGCTTYGWPGSSTGYTFCWARNAAGQQLMCSSQEPSIVQAASAVGGASYLYFSADRSGYCTSLDVQNFSFSRPMVP